MPRKHYVYVPQSEYLRVMQELELEEVTLADMAEHLDVSEATARRNLDGLVFQGKLSVRPGHLRSYRLLREEVTP